MNICPKCGAKDPGKYCPECGTKMEEYVGAEKICPECGSIGAYAFCPNCGTKMEEQVLEDQETDNNEDQTGDREKTSVVIPDTAIVGEPQESEANTEQIDNESQEVEADVEPIEEDQKMIEADTDSTETENTSSKIMAEDEIVEEATRTIEADINDIVPEVDKNDNEDGELNAGIVGADPVEEEQKREEKKRKIKRLLKIIGIVAGVIVLAIVAITIIGSIMKDDFDHDMDNPHDATINSLKYQYPDKWEKSSQTGDADIDVSEYVRYVRTNKDDGTFMGDMYVCYLGDDVIVSDLSKYFSYFGEEIQSRTVDVGNTKLGVKEYSIKATFEQDNGEKIDYEATACATIIEKDYSSFFVVIEGLNNYYDSDFCDSILSTIDIDHYKNPRTAKELAIEYNGDNTPGTVIKTGDENVTVTVKYYNGDEEIAEAWSLDEDMILYEGETSEATVSCHGLSGKLEVAGRKPVKLKAKYNGDTEAGTVIKEGSEDVTVKVVYDTGEKEEVTDWTMDKKIKLKADQTSTAKISAHGLTCELKVACTTMSESGFKSKCESYSYNNILRDPNKYDGKYIKISGKVNQVISSSTYKVATSGGWDNDIYVVDYRGEPLDNLTSQNDAGIELTVGGTFQLRNKKDYKNVIEDDWITIYGVCSGNKTYTTVLGAEKTIPQIDAYYIDFN